MKHPILCALSALAALAAPARAGDWWVDAALGDDANGGTSPADAWRTIAHALASVPPPAWGALEVVHVAPGTYDAALGEVFPLRLVPRVQVVGDGGPAVTIVAPGGATGFLAEADGTLADTLVAGLTVDGAGTGLAVVARDQATVVPRLRDVVVRGAAGAGVSVSVDFASLFIGSRGGVVLDDVRVEQCGVGLAAANYGDHNAMPIDARGCAFVGSAAEGVRVQAGGPSGDDEVRIDDCRIDGSGLDGLRLSGGWGCCLDVRVRRTTLAAGGRHGLSLEGGSGVGGAILERCTLAGNAAAGVFRDPLSPFVPGLDTCVLWGNGDDVDGAAVLVACDVEDGDGAGANGNFSADPLFVDAAGLDFRLLPGSPCVDAGSAALGPDPDCTPPDVGAFALLQAAGPTVYCTAKTSSLGCAPAIGSVGVPSAGGPEPFTVAADDVVDGVNGLLFYGLSGRASLPFLGGTLCALPPLRRTPVQNAGGMPGGASCTGRFELDFRAWIQGGADPLLVPGATVQAQYWMRDPAHPDGTGAGLSDALELTVCA